VIDMHAHIVTIGDELLIGQVVNTNQAHIAEQLNLIGIPVDRMTTIGDNQEEIMNALRATWQPACVSIVTGGLGPTHDDVTKQAAARFFSCGLVSSPSVRANIVRLYARRNLPWSPSAEEQTMVPEKAEIIPNPVGSAPCLYFHEHDRHLFILPGVPFEMREIMEHGIIPLLQPLVHGSVILHRTLRTTGITESMLAQRLGDMGAWIGQATLAFLPAPTGVRLRITAREETEARAGKTIEQIEDIIRERAGRFIYGIDNEELEEIIGRLLTSRGLRIAVAESCTGGLIANRLTNVSGSSAYFERGVVTYSNRSKVEMLGVPESLLKEHGAVSREVAEAMALGIRRVAGTDIGLSTTGIAGPTGGTEEKPVGLLWIGHADAGGSVALKFQFGDERLRFKERASQAALELVRRKLLRVE
jgi:nicotinamide-nucleotide amidase